MLRSRTDPQRDLAVLIPTHHQYGGFRLAGNSNIGAGAPVRTGAEREGVYPLFWAASHRLQVAARVLHRFAARSRSPRRSSAGIPYNQHVITVASAVSLLALTMSLVTPTWGVATAIALPLLGYIALRVFEDIDDVIGDLRVMFAPREHLVQQRIRIREEFVGVAEELEAQRLTGS